MSGIEAKDRAGPGRMLARASLLSLAIAIGWDAASAQVAAPPSLAPEAAPAQGAATQSSEQPLTPDPGATTDIVVTGVRAGLRSAIADKRAADNISDIIKAEDIGKLPDVSVADSLQRVTGVQIIRNIGASRESNTGQPVNIRGLASNSLIDGRAILTGETTRDVDFRTLAAGGFGSLVVSKSPTADRIEGGLGGTIELVTRNPLDIPKAILSARAQAVFLDYSGTFNPDLSAFYGQTSADGRLGMVIAASYRRVRTRQDQFSERGGWIVQNGFTGSGFDLDRNGTADLIVPSDLRINYGGDEQKRIGIDAAIAFQATDELVIKVNGDLTRYDRNFFNGIFRASPFGASGYVPGSGTIRDDGTLIAATFNNQLIQGDGRLEVDQIQSAIYGINAKWDAGRAHVSVDVANARGSSRGRQLVNRFSLLTNRQLRYDFTTPGEIPTIEVAGVDLEDRSLYRTDLTFNDVTDNRTREFSARIDIGYDFDGFLSKLSLGGRYSDANFAGIFDQQNNVSNQLSNPAVFDPVTGQRRTAAFPGLDPLFKGFPVDQVFDGTEGTFPRRWLYTSYPGGGLKSAGEYGEIYNLDAAGKTRIPNNISDVSERTIAGYVRADFGTDLGNVPVRGNIGARVVQTRVSSIDWSTIAIGQQAFVEVSNTYVDVLPSATVIADLNDKLVLRVAAGTVMRRPFLGSLRSPLNIQPSDNTASAGNIDLAPFRANQIDATLEWYFSRDGLLSSAVFYRDVRNFVETVTQRGIDLGIPAFNGSTIYTVTRPVNAGTAKIKGLEVSYQQAFTFLPGLLRNLGVITNYTFSDASTSQGRDFPGLSKHTGNVIAYYDDNVFALRTAFNYRSRFVSGGDGSNGLNFLGIDEYVAPSVQLDLSAQYQLSDNIGLQASVTNVTDEAFVRYAGTRERVRDYRVEGRTFALGVNVKF